MPNILPAGYSARLKAGYRITDHFFTRSKLFFAGLPEPPIFEISGSGTSSRQIPAPTLTRVSPHFAWKRNGSENERSQIAKKRVTFACFALKRNGIFWMRNELIRSEKYRKYRKSSQFRETRNQNLEYIFAILQNINDFFKDKKIIQNCILLEHVHLMYCTVYTVHSTVYTRRF